MKKMILKSALLAVASVGLMAGSAMALPILTLSDGVSPDITINDNGAGDMFSAAGAIGYMGSVGGWDITMSMGSSYPAIGNIGFPELHLTGSTTSTGPGTLTFTFEDTFSAWDSNLDGLVSGFGGFASGNVSFITYLDGIELANFGPVSGAFSDSLSVYTTPLNPLDFKVSIVGTITHTSQGQSSSFDGGVAPVPEPATMLLFGTGLAGLAGFSRKKSKKA